MLKKGIMAAALAVLAAGAFAQKQQVMLDKVVAVVGSSSILYSEVADHARQLTAQRRADEHENHQRAEHEIHRQRRLILIGGNLLFGFDVFLHSLRLPFFSHYSTIYAAHVSFFSFQPASNARAAVSAGFSCIFISRFLQIFGRFGFSADRREFLEIHKFFLIFSEKTVYKSLFPCYNILDFRAWRTRPSRHNPSWF